MKIAADKNILYAKESFGTLGEVNLFDLDEITNENIRDFDVLIVRSAINVNKKLIDNTKIKFIGSAVAGTDHIDIDYLKEKKIGFSSAAGCNSRSVAEYVITAIYAFCSQKQISPKDLTAGIIGVGNIGSKVAQILQNSDTKTLLNDPILKNKSVPLDEIAKNCDIITIHTPLTKSGKFKTENLLDEEFFSKMKKDALLIQASRGKVCNENALCKAMCKDMACLVRENSCPHGIAAVSDVWANEPSINPELAKKCFFRTPHIAGHSLDGKINGTKIIYENCCGFFGKKPEFDFEKEVFAKIEKQAIEYDGSIADILLKCCPIDKDTEEFNKLLKITDENERRNAFKKQRANYHKRLEFSHYEIKNAPVDIAEKLQILGFSA